MTLQFITIIPDRKGVSKPRVCGDEYVVDAIIKMTVYHDADVINASDLGLAKITAACLTGQSTASNDGKTGAFVEVTSVTTGAYTSSSSIKIFCYDNDGDCAEYSNGHNFDEVTLSEEEVNGLSDKKLALAQRLLRLESKEAVLKQLLPEKTIVKTVTSAVKSVTPTLNKKVILEQPSDEASLAHESE